MVASSAISRPKGLQFLANRREQIRVRAGVDLALQDSRRARDREIGDLVAQLLARARLLLLCFLWVIHN
jgi:hypothetical protein